MKPKQILTILCTIAGAATASWALGFKFQNISNQDRENINKKVMMSSFGPLRQDPRLKGA